jgi:hypothetical protein
MTQVEQHKRHRRHQHPLHCWQLQLLQDRHHPHLLHEHKKLVEQPRLTEYRASLRSLLRRTAPGLTAHHRGTPVASLIVPSLRLVRSAALRLWLTLVSSVFPYPTTFSLSPQPLLLYIKTPEE